MALRALDDRYVILGEAGLHAFGFLAGLGLVVLHAAEIATVLEVLPSDARSVLWYQVPSPIKGDVFVEARREVRDQLIDEARLDELVWALERLDPDAGPRSRFPLQSSTMPDDCSVASRLMTCWTSCAHANTRRR